MELDLFQLAQEALEQVFRPGTPIDTGNMRYNATKCLTRGSDVVIKVDAQIAPYVVYTNEPWISEYWKGRKNPNEGWFERLTEAVAIFLAAELGGTLEEATPLDDTKDIAFEQYRTERSAWDDNFNNYYQGRYRK